LVADIESRGGRVTYQFKYVDAIAAEVPRNVLASMRDTIGVGNITKDEIIPLPSSVDTLRGRNLTPSNAANEITFSPASAFRNAVLAECASCFLNPPANTQIPLIGTAPLSNIYALRIAGPTSPSPLSRTLAAVERLIELRQKFDAGEPGGVNVQVANMSFGLPTSFAGRDLFDTTVDALLTRAS